MLTTAELGSAIVAEGRWARPLVLDHHRCLLLPAKPAGKMGSPAEHPEWGAGRNGTASDGKAAVLETGSSSTAVDVEAKSRLAVTQAEALRLDDVPHVAREL